MGKLTDGIALITGALQGIGEGTARTSARHNANLVLLDISPKIKKLVDELYGRGHRYTAVVAGVRDPASIVVAVKRAKEEEGCIDILVNSAGVYRLGSPLDMGDDDRDFHVDISTKGVWNITKTVLPEMIARKDGRIVMMFSVVGDMVADPDETVYVLTKTAIADLTKSLAMGHAQSDVHVNAIYSGHVCTPAAESTVRQSNPENPESVLTEMAKTTPMRRLADPLEVDELAVFLASDGSSYLIDTQNMIDGGSTLLEAASIGI